MMRHLRSRYVEAVLLVVFGVVFGAALAVAAIAGGPS